MREYIKLSRKEERRAELHNLLARAKEETEKHESAPMRFGGSLAKQIREAAVSRWDQELKGLL